MAEPLSHALAEASELKSKLAAYEKDKDSLAQTKGRLSAANNQARAMGAEMLTAADQPPADERPGWPGGAGPAGLARRQPQQAGRPLPPCLTRPHCDYSLPQIKNLEWELEVLQQRHSRVQAERDELLARFEASLHEVQQKTGARRALAAGGWRCRCRRRISSC
jgi:hypothetical protein